MKKTPMYNVIESNAGNLYLVIYSPTGTPVYIAGDYEHNLGSLRSDLRTLMTQGYDPNAWSRDWMDEYDICDREDLDDLVAGLEDCTTIVASAGTVYPDRMGVAALGALMVPVEVLWEATYGERTQYAIVYDPASDRWAWTWSECRWPYDADRTYVPAVPVLNGDNGITWYDTLTEAVAAATDTITAIGVTDPEWTEEALQDLLPEPEELTFTLSDYHIDLLDDGVFVACSITTDGGDRLVFRGLYHALTDDGDVSVRAIPATLEVLTHRAISEDLPDWENCDGETIAEAGGGWYESRVYFVASER